MPTAKPGCAFFILFLVTASLHGEPPSTELQVIFMEPETASSKDSLPAFHEITDQTRLKTYQQWIQNDAANWAFDLYSKAWKIKSKQDTNPVYYIAIVPEGNHARIGFQLSSDSGMQSFPKTTYIELDPDESVFKAT